ncbi:uncharacterized protein LOC117877401 isoform X2 [Trachemys scripta elegans]|uniref:uncharacterized protein LOC117877401 isoform X2 n=1 Tax=Trachemys scripta elegans TaxID=31138 RepID=UPI0015526AD7|nr:uncharacterized protein LOC117877401 isoform X2 [Trachemys scripta elegans]
MAEAFAVMRQELNRKAVEATKREYDQFVQELDRDHQSMSSCLRVKPLEMQRRLEGKCQELLERCQGELWGEDPQKQEALEELKKELDKQMAEFLARYEQRFKMAEMAEMREKANRGAVEAARREYGLFVKQLQDRGHQSMSSCLRVKPLEMKRCQEGKRQELLKRCWGELRGEDPQKQAALEELKQELDKQMDQFLSAYGQRFKVKKAEWLGLYIVPSPAASARRAWARPDWPVHLPISKRLWPIGCPFRRWDGGSKGFWDL